MYHKFTIVYDWLSFGCLWCVCWFVVCVCAGSFFVCMCVCACVCVCHMLQQPCCVRSDTHLIDNCAEPLTVSPTECPWLCPGCCDWCDRMAGHLHQGLWIWLQPAACWHSSAQHNRTWLHTTLSAPHSILTTQQITTLQEMQLPHKMLYHLLGYSD